jgi:hypothetical protein
MISILLEFNSDLEPVMECQNYSTSMKLIQVNLISIIVLY